MARVVHALLLVASGRPAVGSTATSATARSVRGDLHVRVVRLGLFDHGLRGRSGSRSSRRGGDWWALILLLDWRRRGLLDLLGLGGWGIIDGGMLASCAWRDGEEFLEGQDAGLAAFPAWAVSNVGNKKGISNSISWVSSGSPSECDTQKWNSFEPQGTYLSAPRGTPEGLDDTRTPPRDH